GGAAALLAALGAVALGAPAASTQGSGTPSPGSPGRPLSPVARYRVVGCRSRGGLAYRHGPARREAAISFDDGPGPDTTAFVGMLERSHARATFFMIGEQVSAAYSSTLLRELR